MTLSRAGFADLFEADLRERVLPYWRKTVDPDLGGFRQPEMYPSTLERLGALARGGKRVLASLARRRPLPRPDKNLVTQTRILWTLSLADRLGYGPDGGYRSAADHGYRFLTTRLLDLPHGGYAWRADLRGRVVDPRKVLYGQAFALFALAEYHRATGLAEPLEQARALFDVVQTRMHDDTNGGWIEHATADFTPLDPGMSVAGIPQVGLKSANAHLHWMEALTEHVEVSRDVEARSALREALDMNLTFFFPADPALVHAYRTPDWRAATGPPGGVVSYGHNVEFAWLMLRAEEVLGAPRSRERFDALLRHTLRWGFDGERGGFYDGGHAGGPATRRSKIWWSQAEGLAALTTAVGQDHDPQYEDALDLLLSWIVGRQRLPDGAWAPLVEPDGRRRAILAPGAWKGGYHEVRAMARFVAAFG